MQSEKRVLRILSWNIRQGGGSRSAKVISALRSYNADIVVLSEFRNNRNGHGLRSALRRRYQYQFAPQAPSAANSVCILSKIPFQGNAISGREEKYIHAVIKAEFPAFHLYGVYLPHKKRHVLFEAIQQELSPEIPSIIAGDFNTGFNFIDQKKDSFWYQDEIKAWRAAGLQDAFRIIHGDRLEYSWYSHAGNGYRYDHIWLNGVLTEMVGDCYYSQTERLAGTSDHALQVLELRF